MSRTKATTRAVNAEATVGIAAALEGAAAGRRPRQYLVKMRSNMTAQLTRVFDQPGVKMVCLNDDIDGGCRRGGWGVWCGVRGGSALSNAPAAAAVG